jgi:ribosomal protein S6
VVSVLGFRRHFLIFHLAHGNVVHGLNYNPGGNMIYETAFVVRPDASEEVVSSIKNSLTETFKEFGAEVLVNDSWGVKTFAQPTESGLKKGAYHYFMYKGAGNLNAEIERKLTQIKEGKNVMGEKVKGRFPLIDNVLITTTDVLAQLAKTEIVVKHGLQTHYWEKAKEYKLTN